MKQLFGSSVMLAGGKSTRMGRDKSLITENTTRILNGLSEVFSQVMVSGAEFAGNDRVMTVRDMLPDCGPLGGIFAALCLSRSEYLFVQPCDMPNVDMSLIGYLQRRTAEALPQVCIAASGHGLQPLIGFYSRELLGDMRDFLLGGGRKLHSFLEGKSCLVIEQAELAPYISAETFDNYNIAAKPESTFVSPLITEVAARRFTLQKDYALQEAVAREVRSRLCCNGKEIGELCCSPDAVKELALGRLFTLGLIEQAADVKSLIIGENMIDVRAEKSVCPQPASAEKRFAAENLIALSGQFLARSAVFDKTGGVHSAAVSDGEELKCFFEDIGRYNGADKCIGFCLEHTYDMRELCLFTSGRVASDIIEKAARAGFPLVVSRAAPTDAAIEAAKRHHITLIAFARNGRFNIYSDYERVIRK